MRYVVSVTLYFESYLLMNLLKVNLRPSDPFQKRLSADDIASFKYASVHDRGAKTKELSPHQSTQKGQTGRFMPAIHCPKERAMSSMPVTRLVHFCRPLIRSTSADTAEDLLALSQLLSLVGEVVSLSLRYRELSDHADDLRVRDIESAHGGEDVVQTSDNVPLDDLGGDIGDESLLLDLLRNMSGIVMAMCKTDTRQCIPCKWQASSPGLPHS